MHAWQHLLFQSLLHCRCLEQESGNSDSGHDLGRCVQVPAPTSQIEVIEPPRQVPAATKPAAPKDLAAFTSQKENLLPFSLTGVPPICYATTVAAAWLSVLPHTCTCLPALVLVRLALKSGSQVLGKANHGHSC